MLLGDALTALRRLARKNPRTGERRSLRAIAAELTAEGHINPASDRPFSIETIRMAMLPKDNAKVVRAAKTAKGKLALQPVAA